MSYEELLASGRDLQRRFIAEVASLQGRQQSVSEWAGGRLDEWFAENGRGKPAATPGVVEEVGRDDASGTSGESGEPTEPEA